MGDSEEEYPASAGDLKVTLYQFLIEFLGEAYKNIPETDPNYPKLKFLYRLHNIMDMMDEEDLASEFVKRTSRYWDDVFKEEDTVKYYKKLVPDGKGGEIPRWRYNLIGHRYEKYVKNYLEHLFIFMEDDEFKEDLWNYLYTLIGHAVNCISDKVAENPPGIDIDAIDEKLTKLGY